MLIMFKPRGSAYKGSIYSGLKIFRPKNKIKGDKVSIHADKRLSADKVFIFRSSLNLARST